MKSINSDKILKIKLAGLPAISAFFWFLSLPSVGLTFFSWFALVPLLFFLKSEKVNLKWALWGSAFAGFFYALAVLWPLITLDAWWWVPYEYNGFFSSNKEIILTLFLIPACLYTGSTFFIAFGALFRKWGKSSVFSILFFTFLWVVFEIIRLPFVLGFTWGVVGYNLHDYLYLRQLAGIFGVFSLSFIVILVNLVLCFLLKEFFSEHKKLSFLNLKFLFKSKIFYLLLAVLISANLYGFFIVKAGVAGEKSIKIAAIHSELNTEQSGSGEVYSKNMEKIRESVGMGADVVVLPENFFLPFLLDREVNYPVGYGHPGLSITRQFDELMEISSENPKLSIVAGIHATEGKDRTNSLVSIKDGKIVDIYDKRRLLPITESDRLKPGDPEKSYLDLNDNLKASAFICSETIFPFMAKDESSAFILNPSNDSVFKSDTVAIISHIMGKMRAVESGKYLVRSVKGGISAVFDPFGRVITQAGFDTDRNKEIIFADIRY